MDTNPPSRPSAAGAEWRALLVAPELIEVQRGPDSCLLPVRWDPATRSRRVDARGAESPWFPDLAAQLERLLPALPGRFVVDAAPAGAAR